jgi:putative DNA primase/helicase
MNGRDLDRARDALHAISPGLPRDEWVRVGMAAQAAGLGFDDFDAWSAQADNYEARAARDAWRSFKPDGRTGAGSLFYLARAEGWSDKGERTARTAPPKAPARPVEPRRAPRPGVGAAEVWPRLETAAVGHPYIVAKQGTAEGLRMVPAGDRLRIAGQSVAGWLVVPVVPLAGGEPTSLQFIPPPGSGKKLNLPGVPVAGVFIVGDMATAGAVYVCEGIGQAWACWKASGCAAVVCFGWGRVRAVAAELRQRDPSARLVLVPDVGKEADAETIAREVAGSTVELPEGWPVNADVNDYAQREGFDALEVLLSGASEPAKPEPRFKLLGRDDLHALPPLEWRVRGVLPAVGVAALFGPSASGKSFLAFDLAAYIAEGRDWFGHRVNAAPVVYVALEGEAGFRLRAEAWEQVNGRRLPPGLRLVLQGFKLAGDVPDLAAAILAAVGAGAVVFVDTLNRAAPMADENSSRDMGEILEGAKELQRLTAGLVMLVHHTGKDAARGLRGHSSLFAALDAAVEVSRDGDRREWKVSKSKDGADGDAYPFRLEAVNLAPDDEGEPATSCVVRRDESPENATRSRLPKGGNQKVVLDALGDLLRKSANRGMAGAPPQRPCVEAEAAIEAIAPRLLCEPLRRKERTRQALTGLQGNGVLTCREGWLWLP